MSCYGSNCAHICASVDVWTLNSIWDFLQSFIEFLHAFLDILTKIMREIVALTLRRSNPIEVLIF